MIDKVPFRVIQRITAKELEKLLDVNGGIVFVTVEGEPTFVVQRYSPPLLTRIATSAPDPSSNKDQREPARRL